MKVHKLLALLCTMITVPVALVTIRFLGASGTTYQKGKLGQRNTPGLNMAKEMPFTTRLGKDIERKAVLYTSLECLAKIVLGESYKRE